MRGGASTPAQAAGSKASCNNQRSLLFFAPAAITGLTMTTIGMQYDVKPGKEEEFEKGFLGTLELLKTLPGHVESHLYEDVASPGSYVILSRWESKEQYAAFLKSDAFKQAVAWGKAEILRSRPQHRVYQDDQPK
jgi:heme-degrading monooxygenase HmoA